MMSDERTKTAALTAFTQYMTKQRLRKTPERYAILDKVMEMNSHFIIDTLHQMLEADGYHVSLATVYNTMQLLVDAGLVRRHTFGNQTAQYEKITEASSNHHHLVCSRCGKVKEVNDPEVDAVLSSRRYSSFQPAYADLYIYGVCSRCLRKSKRKKAANPKKTN